MVRASSLWQRALLAVVAVVGVMQLTLAFVDGMPSRQSLDSPCHAWDRRVADTLRLELAGAAGERTDALVARLQRARANCNAGRLGLARQDYDALLASAARDFDSPALSASDSVSQRPSP
jgi:hypothetical protein